MHGWNCTLKKVEWLTIVLMVWGLFFVGCSLDFGDSSSDSGGDSDQLDAETLDEEPNDNGDMDESTDDNNETADISDDALDDVTEEEEEADPEEQDLRVGNGESCLADVDCLSGHCQNGFCCDSGDCCAVAADCPTGTYSRAPVCDDPATCQGHRMDPACENNMCAVGEAVPDDSDCTQEVDSCGYYHSIRCNGRVDQEPPVCPTSCIYYDNDCDPGTYCDMTTNTCQLYVSYESMIFRDVYYASDPPVEQAIKFFNIGITPYQFHVSNSVKTVLNSDLLPISLMKCQSL